MLRVQPWKKGKKKSWAPELAGVPPIVLQSGEQFTQSAHCWSPLPLSLPSYLAFHTCIWIPLLFPDSFGLKSIFIFSLYQHLDLLSVSV